MANDFVAARSKFTSPGESARKFGTKHADWDRGGGHPPTPATPPYVRVRIRRFESVTLTVLEQCWKSQRFEVGIRKPNRKGLGLRKIPRAATAAGGIVCQPLSHPQFQ